MADHTTYQIYCREPQPCEAIPRLTRAMANTAAREHADEHGHLCEVVKVQFTVMGTVYPTATAIGQGQPA